MLARTGQVKANVAAQVTMKKPPIVYLYVPIEWCNPHTKDNNHDTTYTLYNTIQLLVPRGGVAMPLTRFGSNVRGEPVFSVMAAGWFCE